MLTDEALERVISVLMPLLYFVWPLIIWRVARISRAERYMEAKVQKD